MKLKYLFYPLVFPLFFAIGTIANLIGACIDAGDDVDNALTRVFKNLR